MPYIKKHDRENGQKLRSIGEGCKSAGELNFSITSLVHGFINNGGVNYSTINEAVGALECAKLELYRRVAVPYEDGKISENGDVYL